MHLPRSHPPSPELRLRPQQCTDSTDDGQGQLSSLCGDEDADSQDFSDSSSDAEGVFAFYPPTTAEQRTALEHRNDTGLSTSQNRNFSPQSEDANTLVGSPKPQTAALAGPSRLISQARVRSTIEHYKFPRQDAPDPDQYNASRPSSSASYRQSKSNVRIVFAEGIIIREKGTEKSDVVTEAGESVLGFEFDDTESRDGSKECVPTPSTRLLLMVLQV